MQRNTFFQSNIQTLLETILSKPRTSTKENFGGKRPFWDVGELTSRHSAPGSSCCSLSVLFVLQKQTLIIKPKARCVSGAGRGPGELRSPFWAAEGASFPKVRVYPDPDVSDPSLAQGFPCWSGTSLLVSFSSQDVEDSPCQSFPSGLGRASLSGPSPGQCPAERLTC